MNRAAPMSRNKAIPTNKTHGPVLPSKLSIEKESPDDPANISHMRANIVPIIMPIKLINNPPAAIFTSIRFLYFSSSSLFLKINFIRDRDDFLNNPKKNTRRKNNPAKRPPIIAICHPKFKSKNNVNFPVVPMKMSANVHTTPPRETKLATTIKI